MTGNQIHAVKTCYIHVKEQEICAVNYVEQYELYIIVVIYSEVETAGFFLNMGYLNTKQDI